MMHTPAHKFFIPPIVAMQESYAVQVLRFMIAMDQPPGTLSEAASPETLALADKLMFGDGKSQGEVEEMVIGWEKFKKSQSLEHLTEFVDGAIDAIYVILWTLNKLGVPADKCFAEVQRSNMEKLQPDGTCLKKDGKVQKPTGWTPPDLFGILLATKDQTTWSGNIATHKKEGS